MSLRALQGPTGGGTPVGGTGTTNTIPRWTGPSTLGDSLLSQSGTIVSAASAFRVAAGTNWSTNDGGLLLFSNNGYKIGFDSVGSTVGYIRYQVDTAGSTLHGHMFSAGALGSPTNLMFIRSDGNVGIGTASPAYKLHIEGTSTNGVLEVARLSNANAGSSATAELGFRTGATDTQRAYVSAGYGPSDYNLSFGTTIAGVKTETMRLTQGNVGIGTASPNAKLEIASTSSGGAQFRLSNAAGLTNWWEIGRDNATTGALIFASNTGERMRISPGTSQVAIGTSSFTTGRALTTVADLDVFGVRVGRGGNASSTANVCVGATALDSGTAADYVTAIGTQAIQRHNGLDNTAIGYAAHRGSSTLASNTGIRNTALGILSLTAISTGSNNTAVGSRAGDSITTGSSNIIIGSDADLAAATDSNKLVIGDATNYVATNGGATTYYATAGALAGYIIVRLNGTDVKLPVYAL